MNIEHRTSNIELRMNEFCLFKKKTAQHAAQAPAPQACRATGWKRCTSESTLRNLSASERFCGSLVLKSIERSVINIGRSMFDVQLSLDHIFSVIHGSGHDAGKKQIL